MKPGPTLLLRVAAILSFLFAVGHTSGGLSFWSPLGETDVLKAMRSFHFDAAGSSRSYMDFYLGFGYMISVYQILQAVVLWQLASIAKTDAFRIRPLIGAFVLASIALAVLAWKFIFIVPVICCVVIAACLALAFYAAGKTRSG